MPLCFLSITEMNGRPEVLCKPKLDLDIHQKNHELPFREWWEKEEIFRTPSNYPISRKYLVNCIRNTDNSAHFDKFEKHENYEHFKARGFGWKLVHPDGSQEIVATNAHLACIRQVGWELDQFVRKFGV